MRKRDDPHQGYLYRVVEWDVDEKVWVHTNYSQYGRPRTYMTLSAARGVRSTMESAAVRHGDNSRRFGVQRMPVENWELVDG